ncbi:hypothetical protein H0A64_01775 [Alcaligenaceae bacterium]|nr:hypothetical protein [Alcaligenaceae bacterium]
MKRLLIAAGALAVLFAASASLARGGVDFFIGTPGASHYERNYYHPPARYQERPRVLILPERAYRPPIYSYRPPYFRDEYRGSQHFHQQKHFRQYEPRHHYKHHHRGHRGRGWRN